MDNKVTKRLTRDKSYQRPAKTYQDNLSNQEIKEKLKEYKKVVDIRAVSIGTHIRYFAVDPKTNEKTFRLGGTLNKVDPEGRFIILGNGTVSWSVQIPNTVFFQKMTENEFKEELKKELKKELMTEDNNDEDTDELKKEIKNLNKKIDQYKIMEKEFKSLVKKNELLTEQITKIEQEIKRNKSKK
jgi:hypothetical protein